MDGIQDKKLLTIAKAIGNNEKLLALALELKFSYADFQNFKDDESVRKQESTSTKTDQPQPVKSPSRKRINQYVSEEELEKISRKFPNENFTSFSRKLGIGATESNNILTKHCKDYRKALMEILMMWKNRTSGPCTELEDALRDSEAGYLIENILYK